MIKNRYIWLIASLVLVGVSCKKEFLEEKRDFGGVNEEVFKDAVLAKAYVDFVYGLFLPGANSQSLSWNLASGDFNRLTEEFAGETNWNKPWASISFSNGHALGYFSSPWTRMKQINIFLSEIDKHGLPEDERRRLKGQMYFWRAFQYFDLVRLYGGVPLVLTPQDPIGANAETNAVPRSSSSETIEQIVKDLDEAIAMLPGKWGSGDWSRITSGAAAALKGRVLLTWASPLFNRTDDRARWQRAYEANLAAKTLLEANGFGLYKKGSLAGGAAWGNMWFEEQDNPEAVIVFGFNNIVSDQTQRWNGWEQAARPKAINGGGSLSPTKQKVDAFPMRDGKMPGESKYTYEAKKFYKDRDPRFYKTFAYNGSTWPYQGNPSFKLWTYRWYAKEADATPTRTTETLGANSSGVYLSKATNPAASNTQGNFSQSGTDFMEMRFAEVVLNLAESAIGADKFSEGLAGIISIRERAGVENADGSYGLSGVAGRDQLFAAVLNERKVEFAYEGKRVWDLRRWMLYNNDFGTVARLGFQPIEGIRRTGYFITVKKQDGTKYVGDPDPLVKPATGYAPVINRDSAVAANEYGQFLDYLYDNHFTILEKNDLDPTNPVDWSFKWYNEYYFFGFNQSALNASPYLEQTQGWNSLKGAGTFDPLK